MARNRLQNGNTPARSEFFHDCVNRLGIAFKRSAIYLRFLIIYPVLPYFDLPYG